MKQIKIQRVNKKYKEIIKKQNNKYQKMQKIKKGLQQKLNLISKIKNNLKIKKYQFKKPSDNTKIQFPTIQKTLSNGQKQNIINVQNQVKNPQTQHTAWINIKKITNNNQQLAFLTPNLSTKKSTTSFDDKILLINTYTSRFASKNSLMKLVQLKSIGREKSKSNLSTEMLRKTFLQKTSRTFSPDKNTQKLLKRTSPQKQLNFFGKINQINHISGTRFKTLDPRFGGLTREQLKQKIKSKQTQQINFYTISQSPRISQSLRIGGQSPRIGQSLNLYEIQSVLNDRSRYSSIQNYNFNSYEDRIQRRRLRKKKDSRTKDRYSPWNQNTQQVVWDQLPKIK